MVKVVPADTAALFILTRKDVELSMEQVDDTEQTQVLVPKVDNYTGNLMIIFEFAIRVLAEVKVNT
jgi:hypothetical protein